VQSVYSVPRARDVQSDVCSTALKEGGVEVVLQVPGGMGDHRIRGARGGGGGRGEGGWVHLSGGLAWGGQPRRTGCNRPSLSSSSPQRSALTSHGIRTGNSAKSSLLRPFNLLSILGRAPLAKFEQIFSSKHALNQHNAGNPATQPPAKYL